MVAGRGNEATEARHALFRDRGASENGAAASGLVEQDDGESAGLLHFATMVDGLRRCYGTLEWDTQAGFTRTWAQRHALCPTVAGLVRNALARRSEEMLESALRSAVQRLDLACIIATRDGEIMFANTAAATLGAASADLTPDLQDDPASFSLHRAIKTIAHDLQEDGPAADFRVYPMRLQGGESSPAYVSALGSDQSVDGEKRWGFVVFVPRRDFECDPEPLQVALGLTPVEAKLTLEIMRGRSVVEASETLSIREQTARSYLKRIFSKLGVCRQSELAAAALKVLIPLRRLRAG